MEAEPGALSSPAAVIRLRTFTDTVVALATSTRGGAVTRSSEALTKLAATLTSPKTTCGGPKRFEKKRPAMIIGVVPPVVGATSGCTSVITGAGGW